MMTTCPSSPINRKVRNNNINRQLSDEHGTVKKTATNTMEAALLLPQDDEDEDEHDPYGALGLIVGGADGCAVSAIHEAMDESLVLFPAPLHQMHQSASEDSYEQQHPQDQQQQVLHHSMKEPLSPQPRRDREKSKDRDRHHRRNNKKKEQKQYHHQQWKEEKEQDHYGLEDGEDEDIVLLAENDDLMTDVHVLVQEYEALKQENVLLQQDCAGFQQDLRVAQSELTSLRTAHQELEDAEVQVRGGVSVAAHDAWEEERQMLQTQLREVRASRDKWKRRAFRVKEQAKQNKTKDLNNKEDARSIFFKAKFLSHLCPPCHVHALTSLGEPVPADLMVQLRASHEDFEHAGHGHMPPQEQLSHSKKNQKIRNPSTRMVSGIPKDICIQEHDGRLDDGMSALPSLAGVTTIHHRIAASQQKNPKAEQSRSNKAHHQHRSGVDQDNVQQLLDSTAFMEKQKSKRHKVLTTREALAKAVRIVNEIKPDGRTRSRRRRTTSYRDEGPEDDDDDDDDLNRSASDVEWELDELREDDCDGDHGSLSSMHDQENVGSSHRRSKNLSRSSGNSREREHHDTLDRDHHGCGSKNLSQKDLSSFLARDSKDNTVPVKEKGNVSTVAHKHAIGEQFNGNVSAPQSSTHSRRQSKTSCSHQQTKSTSSGTRTHASSSKWSSSHGEDHDEHGGASRRKLENSHTATTTSSSRTSSLNSRRGESSSGRGGGHAPNPLNTMIIIEEEQPQMLPEFKKGARRPSNRLESGKK